MIRLDVTADITLPSVVRRAHRATKGARSGAHVLSRRLHAARPGRSAGMSGRSDRRDDPIEDFSRREVAVEGLVKTVYVAGSGPAVILMPEMPGISPDVLRLARWIRDAGF